MNFENRSYTVIPFDSEKIAKELLPCRPERSNKGDFGRVLCVCGSYGMAGAAFLCAKAAYRTGAGLVEIFTHESNRTILQTLLPEAVLTVYGDTFDVAELTSAIERANCVVAGCGLGITPLSRKIISDLLHNIDTSSTPLVLDADALNLLSRNPSLLKYAKGAIITPHAKEMSRLNGTSVDDILASPTDIAYDFALKHKLICVLKDHATVISDGSATLYRNGTGNSGLATGGSGDVLAGIISGLLAQKDNSSATKLETAALAVYLHGLCGDIAAEKLTEYSLMASDVITALPLAFKKLLEA